MGRVVVTAFGENHGRQRALVIKRADETRRLRLDSGGGPEDLVEWRALPGSPDLLWSKPDITRPAEAPRGPRTLVVSDQNGTTITSAQVHDVAATVGGQPFQVMFVQAVCAAKRQADRVKAQWKNFGDGG